MFLFALFFAVIWSLAIALCAAFTGYGRWIALHLAWLLVSVGVIGDLIIGLLLMDESGRVSLWEISAVLAVSGVPVTVLSLARFYRYFRELMDGASGAAGE